MSDFHSPSSPAAPDQPLAQQLSGGVQAGLDAQELPQDGPRRHADDDAEGVLGGDGGGEADGQDAQAHSVGEDGVEPPADTVLKEDAHQTPQENQAGVE